MNKKTSIINDYIQPIMEEYRKTVPFNPTKEIDNSSWVEQFEFWWGFVCISLKNPLFRVPVKDIGR